MRKLAYALIFIFTFTAMNIIPFEDAHATVQSPITRSEAEQRALKMINLSWTYSYNKNSNIDPKYSSYVTLPNQLKTLTTVSAIGIPYCWGGFDGLDTNSYNAPWSNFSDAVKAGSYTGNVNAEGGYGSIPGTAGLDCSGFVEATFNIHDNKLSTSSIFDNYFTKINLSDIKHMDILDKPGSHVVVFNKWGTLNGINGALTYEATPDQTFGGIQGAKEYFLTMNQINNGYIPGRYVNIVEDNLIPVVTPVTTPEPIVVPVTTPAPVVAPVTTPAPVVAPVTFPHPVDKGVFAQVINVNNEANLRATSSTNSAIIGTIPKGTIIYLIDYSSGWYQISFDGHVGWIYGSLIGAIPSGKYVATNAVSSLNIRYSPSTASQIIGTLNRNQYAEVIGYSNDGLWYKISINGIQGWCYNKYLNYIY